MSGLSKTRIMAVERNEALRDGLLALLGEQPDMLVVSMAADVREALLELHRTGPEVTIIDVDLPGSIDLIRSVRRQYPQVRVIPLVNYEWDNIASAAVVAGGSPCIPKDQISRRLLARIRDVV